MLGNLPNMKHLDLFWFTYRMYQKHVTIGRLTRKNISVKTGYEHGSHTLLELGATILR